MIIEWLKYNVPPIQRELFLNADAEIWTETLAAQTGFISKQTWLNPENPDEINFVISWQSKEHWKAVPQELLQETDKRFVEAVGRFELVEVLEYTVL
ncbi:MAG: TIGR03792 family protein [Trueperaceae bacterium]